MKNIITVNNLEIWLNKVYKWWRYFSFMQGIKSTNSNLFKGFCNTAEKEKSKPEGDFYLIIVP